MTKRSPQEIADVEIHRFTSKGHGRGVTLDEKQREVDVPFTIPGDKVRALLMRKKGGVFASRLEAITTPAPQRITPRCVHFGSCGGCRWQQLTYDDQLKIKQELVEKLFLPLISDNTLIRPIIPCDPPWEYRNKMEYTFSSDAAGRQFLGLILDSSRGKVLNLTECHLVHPWFTDALKAVRAWWHESGLKAFHPHSNSGSLRTLILREGMRSGDRLAMLTVSGNPDDALSRTQLDTLVAFIRDAVEPLTPDSHLSIFLRIQQAVKGKETNFYEMLLHGPDHVRETLNIELNPNENKKVLAFDVSPSAFFQPNTKQAEKLYSLALQSLDIPPESVVYDLYCGTGTLGICVAKRAKLVIGIEISPESSLDARTNAKKNGLENVHILTGPARDMIKDIRENHTYPLPDVVMVDPPRAGLDAETLKHLTDLKPKKVLYISCNPTTQAENIKELQAIGYRIVVVQPVDQFPHTLHVENIVVLAL